MQQATLVIMAAGMGSRFGGLKQIVPVDSNGHAIIDYSLFDAYRAGFRRVVFIIKKAIEDDFKAAVGERMKKYFDVEYIYQELDCLPEGYTVPAGREKPWGTGHAVACCRHVISGPFAVINADDFYGAGAYRAIYDFLTAHRTGNEHAMVAYKLRNTVTENGYVSRGICTVENGLLADVTERTHIEKRGSDAAYTENGTDYIPISGDTLVSMNFWGFGSEMLGELWQRFGTFLDEKLENDLMKAEYYLPAVANSVVQEGLGSVSVLSCDDAWHGMTYKEDLEAVKEAIALLCAQGRYPEKLWE